MNSPEDQPSPAVLDEAAARPFFVRALEAVILVATEPFAKKLIEQLDKGAKFEDLHKSGWDPKHRIADQDRDGVAAEVIYPTGATALGPLLENNFSICNPYEDWVFAPETAVFTVREHFKVSTLDGFGLEGLEPAIGAAGAYGFVMSSNYNTRPRAAEIMVSGASAHVVRARETIPGLFAGERPLPG